MDIAGEGKVGHGAIPSRRPRQFPEAIVAATSATSHEDAEAGVEYRLYAMCHVRNSGSAAPHLPLFVKGRRPTEDGKKSHAVVIYDDGPRSLRAGYVPSGHMGNSAIKWFEDWARSRTREASSCRVSVGKDMGRWSGRTPNDGATCRRFES